MLTLADEAAQDEWELLLFGDDLPSLDTDHLHLNTDALRCITIAHRTGARVPNDVPPPKFRWTRELGEISTWVFRVPIVKDDPNNPKPENAYRMTVAMLCAALGGTATDCIPNPLAVLDQVFVTGDLTELTHLRIMISKQYRRHRFDFEARRAGGKKAGTMSTEAQKAARRANFEKARATRLRIEADRANARAREIVAMTDTGADWNAIADRFGLAVGSVPTTVTRARNRLAELGESSPAPVSPSPPAEPKPLVLDEFVATVTDNPFALTDVVEDQGHRVIPFRRGTRPDAA